MWHIARAQLREGVAGRPCVGAFPKTTLSTCPAEAVLKVSNAQRQCKEETWSAVLTTKRHTPNLWLEHPLTPPINTTVLSLAESVKKVRFSPPLQGASQFNLCRVERGEVLRVGGLPSLSGVLKVARARKLCGNPFRFDGVFQALVRPSVGALLEFYELRQRADPQVPLVYQDSGLSRYP
jgi:hypothetical protein